MRVLIVMRRFSDSEKEKKKLLLLEIRDARQIENDMI